VDWLYNTAYIIHDLSNPVPTRTEVLGYKPTLQYQHKQSTVCCGFMDGFNIKVVTVAIVDRRWLTTSYDACHINEF